MSNATVPPREAVHCRHPGPFNNTAPSRSTLQLYHHLQLQLPSRAPRPSQPTPGVVQQHNTKPFYAATGEVKELPFGSSCWFVSAVQIHCHCEYIYGTLGST